MKALKNRWVHNVIRKNNNTSLQLRVNLMHFKVDFFLAKKKTLTFRVQYFQFYI